MQWKQENIMQSLERAKRCWDKSKVEIWFCIFVSVVLCCHHHRCSCRCRAHKLAKYFHFCLLTVLFGRFVCALSRLNFVWFWVASKETVNERTTERRVSLVMWTRNDRKKKERKKCRKYMRQKMRTAFAVEFTVHVIRFHRFSHSFTCSPFWCIVSHSLWQPPSPMQSLEVKYKANRKCTDRTKPKSKAE